MPYYAQLDLMDSLIADIKDTNLIVLPEMRNTGFSMTPKPLATIMYGILVQQIEIWASQKSVIVGGSVIVEANGR